MTLCEVKSISIFWIRMLKLFQIDILIMIHTLPISYHTLISRIIYVLVESISLWFTIYFDVVTQTSPAGFPPAKNGSGLPLPFLHHGPGTLYSRGKHLSKVIKLFPQTTELFSHFLPFHVLLLKNFRFKRTRTNRQLIFKNVMIKIIKSYIKVRLCKESLCFNTYYVYNSSK